MATRRVRQFEWTCENGHRFMRPHLGDSSSGEFLLESPRGSYAIANSFDGVAWNEVVTLLREFPGYASLDNNDLTTVTLHVYSRTIDPDVSGPYRFEPMDCPMCGAGFHSIADIEPPVWVDDVPSSTHNNWLALSRGERRITVAEAVREVVLARDIHRR